MRGNAEDHQHEFSPEVFSTALKNLFLDDSFTSLPSRVEISHRKAIDYIFLI